MGKSDCIVCGNPVRNLSSFCSEQCQEIGETRDQLRRLRNSLLLTGGLVVVVPLVPVILWGVPGLIGMGAALFAGAAVVQAMRTRLGPPAV